MTDQSLLGSCGMPRPLPPDPLSPIPDAVERELAAYRVGDTGKAKAALSTIAESGRTAVAGHAAMALAGVELTENGLGEECEKWLEQVAAGEDPWLGPLAVVMLSADFDDGVAGPEPVLDHLASQLTGDLAAAREGFERSLAHLEEAWANEAEYDDDAISTILRQRDITKLLLGNLLIQAGDSAAALEPLSSARSHCDGLLAAYAGHLEAHVLIEQGKNEPASEVLSYAFGESLPANSRADGLTRWVGIRYGEHLAGNPWMDIVADQVEDNPGVTEGTVVRGPFETACHFEALSRPALAEIGLHLFPASPDFEPVHATLERLKTWSDERHERARRLIFVLHQYVEDSRDEKKTQGLAELWKQLDLPAPR
ncbi:hypothetical protein SAMN02982929_05243 [Saccharopolyspora kobensis]|uniref:Uncharacterized protein n=1 Tax=Saccharopolyspora kobensis TaxID=146035 RepID=A0A1H6DYQ1_9PSEU|nr:hypothetical protein [Saccharopolyspora kobensis]SEG90490.1 hypothetical protein SAMN02982929_05243 [Saccharopolyspora kobensis]SFD91697.1 hypothetical protein SAMN05216506_107217 [Saccharopolyspora kobensis]